jgi:type II secretory pathway component PulK
MRKLSCKTVVTRPDKVRGTRQQSRCWSLVAGWPRQNGTVLIVTIWVVLVLAGLVLVFARSMRVAAIASANHVASLQADSIAHGALQFVIADLASDDEITTLDTGELYEAMEVGGGYFWVIRSNLEDDHDYDYGLTNESAKINLNSATLEMLLKLPGMTAELASAIIDWRDEDEEISAGGAESEYYLLLSEPYNCKNAPFETVEEVRLVKGASQEILFGEDTNLNGVLDDNENDADQSEPADNRDGHLDGGFLDYVTVYSVEDNVDKDGQQRININDYSSRELAQLLREVVGNDQYFFLMDSVRAGRPFQNVLDFYYKSGLQFSEFEQIADRLTTTDEEQLVGLVNVNTASREVLLCLPQLVDSDVDAILAKRESSDTNLDSIAWIAETLDREKAVAIGGHITTRSFQYSADIVAVAGDGRAYKRYRAVLDTRNGTARIVYWKSLTHLGWPLGPDIISKLRSGLALD